jgi:hypothetical protein
MAATMNLNVSRVPVLTGTVLSPYPLIQYRRFTAAPQKLKIKEINGYEFQNERQAKTGRNMVEYSSSNAPSTWLILLCPLCLSSLEG